MCLTLAEAEAIIRARDEAGVQVMVGYMRRFAPAFVQAVAEVRGLGKINYARIRDIIGRNRLIIDQSSVVLRPDDIPEAGEARPSRAGGTAGAGGDRRGAAGFRRRLPLPARPEQPRHLGDARSARLAARRRRRAAWNGGNFLNVLFDYDGYCAVLESGVDEQRRFDAHIEVYGITKSIRVQYDSPYIRHLPTTLVIDETIGDAYQQRVERPTFKDPYTHEIEYFHEVVTAGVAPKTTPEDFMDDLRLMRLIVDALRADSQREIEHERRVTSRSRSSSTPTSAPIPTMHWR